MEIETLIPLHAKHDSDFSQGTEKILSILKKDCLSLCNDKSDYYLRALILWQILNHRVKALEN